MAVTTQDKFNLAKVERELRDLDYVPRWGIVRTLRPQSVATHSYFVAAISLRILDLFDEIEPAVKLATLSWALMHDFDELIMGDVPHPTKQRMLGGDRKHRNAFRKWLHESIISKLPWYRECRGAKWAAAVVDLADAIERMLFVIEDQRLGNTNLELVMEDCDVVLNQRVAAFKKVTGIDPTKFVNKTVWDEHGRNSSIIHSK